MVRPLLASLLLSATAACSAPAHADQPFGPQPANGTAIAIGIADAKIRAPYDVQVVRENGNTLPTYGHHNRFYVQGNAGERYIIRVTNPTARRVEAVVTVDGLDVIDGEDGDLRKRGYVVPPYGEVRIEGFRTSQSDVATFRFNSVNESYANKKGKARNVGVIAVAIFEEVSHHGETQIIVGGGDGTGGGRRHYDYEDDLAEKSKKPAKRDRNDGDEARPTVSKDVAKRPPAEARPDPVARNSDKRREVGPTRVRPAPAPHGGSGRVAPRHHIEDVGGGEEYVPPPVAPRNNRPGLGTEFGENRHSGATFTKFVRAATRPIAVAELRYNNAAGLVALGIHAEPLPDAGEIMTRETADPFPGDGRFATPPRR